MIAFFVWPTILILLISLLLCLVRLARGPSAADQLLAYGTLTSTSIGLFMVIGVVYEPTFLEALVPLALVSFVALLFIARFLEAEVE
jgi:multisubunit Na+/H+ antiporter MnhF subunit